MLHTFMTCREDNNSPEAIINSIRQKFTPIEFVAGVTQNTDKLYISIRAASGKYDIYCRSELHSHAALWKNIVVLIWPPQYEEVCEAIKIGPQRFGSSPRSFYVKIKEVLQEQLKSPSQQKDPPNVNDEIQILQPVPKLPTMANSGDAESWNTEAFMTCLVRNFYKCLQD